ncbi:Hypothetical protein NocV09_02900490 [Nannochloropsis oceanica]
MMYQVHTFGKVIEGQILPEFEKMVLTYKKEMEPILADGKRYLEDIELAEGNVQTAYREYRDQAQALEKMGVSDSELDLWVFEMQYRVAVGLLLETWKVCRSALGALFKRMKDAEMTRRRVTHAALGTVLGQQTTYWKRLPEYGLTLPSQVHPRVSEPRLIEKEIGADVRTGVQRLQHSQEGWRRKIVANRPMPMRTPTPFTSAPGLGGTSVDWSSNSINLALSTNAVAAGAAAGGEVKGVFERKNNNVFMPWKPVLAVLTVDNYLHIFDLPSCRNKATTAATATAAAAAAQEAFESLVAKPETVSRASCAIPLASPTTNLFHKENEGGGIGIVSPSKSFNLDICDAHFKDAKSVRDLSFDIIEAGVRAGGGMGLQGVVKDLANKQVVTLKGRDKAEMTEWCNVFHTLKRMKCVDAAVGAR